MDIQRLHQILSELNPIFWNPEIDRQLESSDYPNQFPIESAKYRYMIALGKLVPHPNFSPCNKKSAPYRQMIIESRSSEKKRFNKLLKKVEECLSPCDKVFEVLLEEFTSPFAKQVLLTHQNLIGEFAGITLDNYQSWTELLVCMSHKDFWGDLGSGKGENTPAQATPKTDGSLIYQADAATFYNIPKSTLSKASNKKPGEPGYLWSGRDGKRVFYRKSDCSKLAKSRTKLRNV